MRIKKLTFIENAEGAQEWSLNQLELSDKNLIVGKNATGKSRTLNVVSALAAFLLGKRSIAGTSSYDCLFEHQGIQYRYILKFAESAVQQEQLLIDDDLVLDRGDGGKGKIKAEAIKQMLDFQTPTSELAVVVRRDNIQHSYLEPLYDWAASLRHYHFGSELGKNTLSLFHAGAPKVDETDEMAVVGIFQEAKKQYPEKFINVLTQDLAEVGYAIEEIGVGTPITLQVQGVLSSAVGLYVKEKDLSGLTDQFSMSQGMFRVLALLIHVNYFLLKQTASCVLVDDIGEGLDFDRSCRLINLLRLKADQSNIQIVLSSNDRFVMNEVPLDEWSILQRINNHVYVKNIGNSKAIFEEFRFTGLSNFSFLEMDFINEAIEG